MLVGGAKDPTRDKISRLNETATPRATPWDPSINASCWLKGN